MSQSEEVKSWSKEVTVINKDVEYAVEVFWKRFHIKMKNSVKCFKGFTRQSSITINLDNLRKERRGNGVIKGFKGGEE